VVPAEYEKMANPTDPDDDESIEIGEELYMKHCKSCHGKEGLGDGPKAAEQKGDLGDFSSAEFQGQSDGALFYKSKVGRDDMPDFSKKIPNDEDIWFIVDFMRTLGE
jgi:mono/diheme cytochrome c family protein